MSMTLRRKGDLKHASPAKGENSSLSAGISSSSAQIHGPLTTPPPDSGFRSPLLAKASQSSIHRFVGDLNPEATFLEPVPATPEEATQPQSTRDPVGIWVNKRDAVGGESYVAGRDNDNAGINGLRRSIINDATALEASDELALLKIYLSRVHPILPILDEAEFWQGYGDKTISCLLVKAICLVAAKDQRAEPYLRLSPNRTITLKPRDFSNIIHSYMRNALRRDTPCDKITLIRVLTLMSLHTEGFDGAEEASMYLAQAIHHVHSIGLHHENTGNRADIESMKKLFWCIWSLDKLNAATNGRPVMVADRDVGVAMYVSSKPEDAAFQVWLKIATTLNQVIDLYRPSTAPSVTGWDDDFPIFEDIVDKQSGWHLHSSVLASLHLFYLIVAILSSRSKGIRDVPRATPSYVRQSLSTHQIISLMDGTSERDLSPLPIYPYGVSLALSVAYKHMRQSRLGHQQRQARADFQACFKILQDLSSTWWSAEIMATLAERVLVEVNKVPGLAGFSVHLIQRGQTSNTPPGPSSGQAVDLQPQSLHDRQNSNNSALGQNDQGIHHIMSEDQQPQENLGGRNDPAALQPTEQGNLGFYDLNTMAFDGMDDIFGAYMDPNFPINFEDVVTLQSG
ncbi:fungal-specific transcription factor domain-containing protein [Bisporella sp. PMI_857]|nr:fungal-specific transcription factor domain-containing protein [Bisporella sp. PMI_857]